MKKHLNKKERYFTSQLLLVLLMIFSSNSHLYAQDGRVKIDTVEMAVNIAVFSDADHKDPETTSLYLSNIVQPITEYFDLNKVIARDYKPKFDGIFITDYDRLIRYGIVIIKAGKNLTVNDPTENNWAFKPVPHGSGKYKYYSKFTVKGKWIRYEINTFKPSEISQKELYERDATHKEGQPYSYYLLHTVKSVKATD